MPDLGLAGELRGAQANKHAHSVVRSGSPGCLLSAFCNIGWREEVERLPRAPQNERQCCDRKGDSDISEIPAMLMELPSELDCGRVGDLLLATAALGSPIRGVAVRAMNLAHCRKPLRVSSLRVVPRTCRRRR
jgi:hypothetical protein